MVLPRDIQTVVEKGTGLCRVFKSGPGTMALLARALLDKGRSVVLVARTPAEASELRSLLCLFDSGEGRTSLWTCLPPATPGTEDCVVWGQCLAGLFHLAHHPGPKGVLFTADVLLSKLPPRWFFNLNHLTLTKGEDLLIDVLLDQLICWGYERVGLVSKSGEIAMRGDILDIYSPGYDLPLRCEFFGDTLEDIRLFDPATQRSRHSLTEAVALPVTPHLHVAEYESRAREYWDALLRTGQLSSGQADGLRRRLDSKAGRMPPGLLYSDASWIEDWLPSDAVYLLSSEDGVRIALEEAEWAWTAQLQGQVEDVDGGDGHIPRPLVARSAALGRVWEQHAAVAFDDLAISAERCGPDLSERRYESFEELMAAQESGSSTVLEARDRPWQVFLKSLKHWCVEKSQVILSFHSERARKKFLALTEEEGLRAWTNYSTDGKGLFALVSPFSKGIDLSWRQSFVLGEDVIQPAGVRRLAPRTAAFTGLARYDDLEPGDLLVHREYGLGRFGGLHRLAIGEPANDYLLLLYEGDDKLYLPVDRLDLVQRYRGPEGDSPTLDRLGGIGWIRSQEKARKAVARIAQDLVEMYAWRKVAKGYSYGALNELYREFEVSFGFEETPDQSRAIADVMQDMELPEPMDRLVCGDVGFGKTEVAMRAAFRANLDGKQVALLCPTTVLAEQHYQNFKIRMRNMPVKVGMLSRFVPAKKQKAVLEAAARGQVDILIGTHRLLSDDVVLPNLGLLILDEEQRFGVRHKEKLKQMKKNVDALTLTATPIPRTLQLSLSGIRELSVIETPPLDRKPVETALVHRDADLLSAVVHRELDRQGQVFWVYNRIHDLDEVVAYVQKLVPDARVGKAHGQMPERLLEDTMHRFWHGELDILVCTAIIESGLDFPNANTLIVDQAHLFGLGQLYQLRGRVGRSERQAYAYFVVHDLNALSEHARKRLRIILELDFLGAGFQVAMEDLRIRGAGNILGEAQTGTVAKVGLDLFLEMLDQEVRRLKGEPLKERTDPEVRIGFAAHIPEAYIADPGERLKYYKWLSSAPSEELRQDVEAEIRDRFGAMPPELENFLDVLGFKRLLGDLGVGQAELYPDKIRLSWETGCQTLPVDHFVHWVTRHADRARLTPPSILELRLEENGAIRERMKEARQFLAGLLSAGSAPEQADASAW